MPILIKEEKLSEKSLKVINSRKNKTKFAVEAIEFYIEYLENTGKDFVNRSSATQDITVNNDEVLQEIQKMKSEIIKELHLLQDTGIIKSTPAKDKQITEAIQFQDEKKHLSEEKEDEKIIVSSASEKDSEKDRVEQMILNSISNLL